MRKNKYRYLFIIQGAYGQGWEDVDQSEDKREAHANYVLYCQNEPQYSHRLIKRRELRKTEDD